MYALRDLTTDTDFLQKWKRRSIKAGYIPMDTMTISRLRLVDQGLIMARHDEQVEFLCD